MTKKLESLTPAQVARMDEYKERWLAKGLATGPCDRVAMEAAADEAYRCAGMEPPKIKIWLQSPFAGAIGAHILKSAKFDFSRDQVRNQVRDQVWNQVGDQVWNQVRNQVGDQVRNQVRDQVRNQVWNQVRDQVRNQVGDQVRNQVRDQVWNQVGDQVWNQVGGQVWNQVGDQVGNQVGRCGYGQHDANWLAFYNFFHEVCGLEVCGKLQGLNLLAECGWWWPFNGAVILTERPKKLSRDSQFRLHCEDGPALSWPDGWAIYAWHGVRLSEWIVEQPELITAAKIDAEPNQEIRRIMIERFGHGRYIAESGAKELHRDWTGILYEKRHSDGERTLCVEVVNSTPEPDGTHKHYFLSVHPELRTMSRNHAGVVELGEPQKLTARNAVASTFGLRGEEYDPFNFDPMTGEVLAAQS